ncbi:OmpL47-type beta-barrel domain-containing protein, partial [Cohnella fermenti]
APSAATLTADPTAPTNGNVTVTIVYPEDASVREYKVGAGAWQLYTEPVEVTDNGTVHARSTDAAGNESEESSYAVSNIDREAPTAATLTADPTAPTSGNVTVTIVYPEDASVREYKVGAGAWQLYTEPVEVTDNGTVHARSTDAAGNESEQSSYAVSNIDREAPSAATLTADPTAPTNGNVTVTIVYPEDASVREYKVGDGAWQLYTEPVEVTDNGTVHARSVDAAGNESEESSYVVSNIDREAPTAATLTADPTAPTNGNVTVTIVYPEDAAVREYKVGGGEWQPYTEPVEVTDNGTVHARSVDAAGNESEESSYVVSNIDREAPAAATLTANPTAPTNGNVTVTITYPEDASVREYKVGDGAWQLYTEPVEVTDNGTVHARSTDAAGNESEESSYVVSNIDREAPTAATLTADPTAPTSGNVTVTIVYPEDASVREYKVGDGAWQLYTEPVEVTDNGTVHARSTDAAGNESEQSSYAVSNIDREAPVLTLGASEALFVPIDSVFSSPSATAVDNFDGDITDRIMVAGAVDTATLGTYELIYSVSDRAANLTEEAITVIVYDNVIPTLSLLGEEEIRLEVGTPFADPGVTAWDAQDGDLTDAVIVTGAVDYQQLNTYTLTYNVEDSAGNEAAALYRTVIIEDTTAPELTVLGDNPLMLLRGAAFTDPGVHVSDNYDMNISEALVTTSSVDTDTAGLYTITYSVSDSSGNRTERQRTVHVLSDDATIAQLTSNTGRLTPDFMPEVQEYQLSVDSNRSSITLSVLPSDNAVATVSIDGEPYASNTSGTVEAVLNVRFGSNAFDIELVAEDGTIRTYTLLVIRSFPEYNDEGQEENSDPDSDSLASVIINGNTMNGGTAQEIDIAGQKIVVVKLDEDSIVERLQTEGAAAVVEIPVPGEGAVGAGELSGRLVKEMEKQQAVVELRTKTAVYTLPAAQINIDTLAEQLGVDAPLEDIKVYIEITTPSEETLHIVENAAKQGKFSLVAAPLDFTVYARYGERSVQATTFKAYVERSVAIPADIEPTRITTGVVVEEDGTVRHVPTKIVEQDGQYRAVINSLSNSTYALIWNQVEFNDMELHWAQETANDMGSRMVVSGDGNGNFSPDHPVTRAEFAAIVVHGLGLKVRSDMGSFIDISPQAWYGEAVYTAHAYGLVKGFEDDTFGPDDDLTREQAMSIIARAMDLTGLKARLPSRNAEQTINRFTDADKISDWARSSVIDSVAAGIVVGKDDNLLATNETITRAEALSFIYRLLQLSELI